MKRVHLIVMTLIWMTPLMAVGQQSGIEAALQKGSAADLGVHFAKMVDITLPQTEDTYSADKAVTILSDFFAYQTVKGYKRAHSSGDQGTRAKYSIGDLFTAKGTYRITLYFDAQDKISEIKIVK